MYEELLAVITERIRNETAKPQMDVLQVKNLVEIAQFVEQKGINSFSGAVSSSALTLPFSNAGVRVAPTYPGGPSGVEQLTEEMGNLIKGVLTGRKPSSLPELVECWMKLPESTMKERCLKLVEAELSYLEEVYKS